MQDKVVILTGGNAGIGFATAQLLLTKGVQTLIIASRSKSKVDE
jgi:NAD(P)-dependent dehydrogenase (short-subunit alcohol dehydrogenase family)